MGKLGAMPRTLVELSRLEKVLAKSPAHLITS